MTEQDDNTMIGIDAAMAQLQAEFEAEGQRFAEDYGEDWLPEYLARKEAHAERIEAAAKTERDMHIEQAKDGFESRMAAVRQLRGCIRWYGQRLHAELQRNPDISTGKKKSIPTSVGKAGYRKLAARKVLVVEDEDAAIADAEACCPAAVKKTLDKAFASSQPGLNLTGTRWDKRPEANRIYIGKYVIGTIGDSGFVERTEEDA